MKKTSPPRLTKLAAAKQRRLDSLLEKYAEGTITEKEKVLLDSLVGEAEQIMVENGRRLAKFAKSQAPAPSVSAVPVTVWVDPQIAQ
jgi:hypothetical protein